MSAESTLYCTTCEQELPEDQWPPSKWRRRKRGDKCTKCHREYMRERTRAGKSRTDLKTGRNSKNKAAS
jgi:hypothetical protein